MNTPRLCISETKKAFRQLMKREDLLSAIQALCNLKGVGPAMASSKCLHICLTVTILSWELSPRKWLQLNHLLSFPVSAPQYMHILQLDQQEI